MLNISFIKNPFYQSKFAWQNDIFYHHSYHLITRLWIGGSYSSAAESTKSEYMDEDGVWTDGPTMPLGMFDHACLAISANEVLVGNGVVQSTVTEQFTAWILNTDTDTFIPTGPANYNGRGAMLGGPFTLSSGR